MKNLSKNTVYSLYLSVSLFAVLFLLRLDRIIYAFREFKIQIGNFNDFVYIFFAIFTDIFFCILIYFFIRLILWKTTKKRYFIPKSILIISILLLAIAYNIADLIYFMTSGSSISWGEASQMGNILNLTSSAAYYLSFYLILVIVVSLLLIVPGSYFIMWLYTKNKEKITLPKMQFSQNSLFIIIIILLFIFSQNVHLSTKSKIQVNSIPVFSIVSSFVKQVTTTKKVEKEEKSTTIEDFDMEKLSRKSKITSISVIDRKTQRTIKEKLKRLKNRNFNVVFYLSESTHAKYLKMYGSKDNPMPFLNSLSAKSLLLKNMYSTGVRSINCLISLLTGLGGYPGYSSITYINPQIKLPALSQLVKKRGYNSALIHSGSFDFYQKMLFLRNRDFDYLVDERNLTKMYPNAFTYSWGIDDKVMVDTGLHWIDRQVKNNKHFFLTFVPIFPHHPYIIPTGAEKLYKHPKDSFQEYSNSLYYVDKTFQRFYLGMKKRGLLENTIIVFLADHGEAFNQHDGNIGHENNIWEENVRIPAIMFNPILFDDYYEFEGVTNTSDIFATIIDILGIEQPLGSQGSSVISRDVGQVDFFACGDKNVDIGLRDGKYKAIFNLNHNKIKLYDLEKEDSDIHDIADNEPAIAIDYKKRLMDYYNAQKEYIGNFENIITRYKLARSNETKVDLMTLKPYLALQQFYKIESDRSPVHKLPFNINDVVYKHGIGVHANCTIRYDIKGMGFKRFTGIAGKLKQYTPKQNFLEMQILLDGKLAFTTGLLNTGDPPVNFDLNIANVSTIELLVLDAKDNQIRDEAAWINPTLYK